MNSSFLLFVVTALMVIKGYAQSNDSTFFLFEKEQHLSSYYVEYQDSLILRIYGIRKFNFLEITDDNSDSNLRYRPNSNFNFGGGFNYKWLGINLAFRAPVIMPLLRKSVLSFTSCLCFISLVSAHYLLLSQIVLQLMLR